MLFGVVREGIEISRRLSVNDTLCTYRRYGYSLSNPSVSRTGDHHQNKNDWRWGLSPETLKRLASSVY